MKYTIVHNTHDNKYLMFNNDTNEASIGWCHTISLVLEHLMEPYNPADHDEMYASAEALINLDACLVHFVSFDDKDTFMKEHPEYLI